MNQFLTQLPVSFDLGRMVNEAWDIVKRYGFRDENQINLTNVKGVSREEFAWKYTGKLSDTRIHDTRVREEDFTEFHPDLVGTYMYEVFQQMPFPCGRFRLMRIKPRSCYSVHRDVTMRIHLAVVTSPSAFIVFPEGDFLKHIPADGHAYLADTTRKHTAMNCGTEDRLHFVASLL